MTRALDFRTLAKLAPGDKVAIVSPSFAAPGQWPVLYAVVLQRLRDQFGLVPIDYPATAKLGASTSERGADLMAAFTDPEIKAVITTIGGDDQVTYVKNLPDEPFRSNPKPFFGFSDNTHFANHLWLNGVPSYYGGALYTQFALGGGIDSFTLKYLNAALFEGGEIELAASPICNDSYTGEGFSDPDYINQPRAFEPNDGWFWDGDIDANGITWGGCLESIDEMLRHGVRIPTLDQFSEIVLITETSEEIPSANYVRRVYRALGERGILSRVGAVLIGRPQAWDRAQPNPPAWRKRYREEQRQTVLETIRHYNADAPIVQNMDFGHTHPQICMPYGAPITISSAERRIVVRF